MEHIWSFVLVTVAVLSGLGLILLLGFGWRALNIHRRRKSLIRGKDDFHLRREWLEAEFLTIASRSGKPRGLEWADCEFHDEVCFARDRERNQLCALVGVAISFEAIEGGGMEDNPNVGNLKAGTAVFRFDGKKWTTDGRALLNLEPDEAIQRLHNELESVD